MYRRNKKFENICIQQISQKLIIKTSRKKRRRKASITQISEAPHDARKICNMKGIAGKYFAEIKPSTEEFERPTVVGSVGGVSCIIIMNVWEF